MSNDDKYLEEKNKIIQNLIPKKTEDLIQQAEISLKENQTQVKKEILKINNLVKKKYFLTKINNDNIRIVSNIKDTALKLNIIAKKQSSEIEDLIKNQVSEIKKLSGEQILLERNDIQLNIIKNQKLLIDDYKTNNDQLQSNLSDLSKELDILKSENKKSLINNNELKNTIGRYIVHNKNLQKTIDKLKSIKSESIIDKSRIKEMLDQIKFYQDDNTRLSNEIISIKDKYQIIKNNFNESENEKNNIFKQIQELNNSLSKTNILGTPFIKEKIVEDNINSKVLNDISENNINKEKEKSSVNNSLDKEIEDIFS